MGVLEMAGQHHQDDAPLIDTRMLGSLFQGIKRFQATAHENGWFGCRLVAGFSTLID